MLTYELNQRLSSLIIPKITVVWHVKPSEVIMQEPGVIIIVHPSAIHNVINLEVNLAESINVLPSSTFLTNICSYKTCEHSEGCNGKPNYNHVEELK